MFSLNIALLYFFISHINLTGSRRSDEFKDINIYSETLASVLVNRLKNVSKADAISNNFRSSIDNYVTFNVSEANQLLTTAKSALEDLLNRRSTALQAVLQKAEELVDNIDWGNDVEKIVVDDIDDSKSSSENVSRVHIPVDVWRQSQPVIKAINWTQTLDEVWNSNVEDDPEIGYQFFGSTSGMLRYFPGTEWPDFKGVDTFDIRRRPPFTVGSSLPKDMMILIDTSGSVMGQTLELIKFTVKALLDTLDDNDYVQVAQFPGPETSGNNDAHKHNDPQPIVSCFKEFVQATTRNKLQFETALDELIPNGMTDFEKAFNFTFDAFKFFENSAKAGAYGERGGRCNKLLMVLTDEVTDYPKGMISEKNKDKDVRIFTYGMGLDVSKSKMDVMKNLACDNGGSFEYIPAMGAVKSKTQEYFDILSLPVNKDDEDVRWTAAYPNVITGRQTISATLPVFRTDKLTNKKEFQGVVGIDVPVTQLVAKLPLKELFPLGLAFIINNNGHVVFFPRLEGDSKEYMQPMAEVDFFDAWPKDRITMEDLKVLRTAILEQKPKDLPYETCLQLDEAFVQCTRRNFIYTNLLSSKGQDYPYKLGFGYPESHIVIATAKEDWNLTDKLGQIQCGSTRLESACVSKFPCQTSIRESSDSPMCSSFYRVAVAEAFATNLVDSASKSGFEWRLTEDFDGIFFMSSAPTQFNRTYPKDFQYELPKDLIQRTYTKSEKEDEWIFFSQIQNPEPFKNLPSTSTVMAVKKILVSASIDEKPPGPGPGPPNPGPPGQKLVSRVVGVVGAALNSSALARLFLEQTDPMGCQDKDRIICVLLDIGGFIIYTNQDIDDMGQFYGDTDPELMQNFVAGDIFKQVDLFDFRATCKVTTKTLNASPRLSPIILNLLNIPWLIWNYFMANINLSSLISSFFYPRTWAASIDTSEDTFIPCVKNMSFYTFGPKVFNEDKSSGEASTCNCTRSWATSRLPNTNLLFMVAQSESCSSNCPVKTVPRLPVEDPTGRLACKGEEIIPPLFRLQPGECPKTSNDKKPSALCAGVVTLPICSTSSMSLLVVSTFWLSR